MSKRIILMCIFLDDACKLGFEAQLKADWKASRRRPQELKGLEGVDCVSYKVGAPSLTAPGPALSLANFSFRERLFHDPPANLVSR